jgi:hypothetical protein
MRNAIFAWETISNERYKEVEASASVAFGDFEKGDWSSALGSVEDDAYRATAVICRDGKCYESTKGMTERDFLAMNTETITLGKYSMVNFPISTKLLEKVKRMADVTGIPLFELLNISITETFLQWEKTHPAAPPSPQS